MSEESETCREGFRVEVRGYRFGVRLSHTSEERGEVSGRVGDGLGGEGSERGRQRSGDTGHDSFPGPGDGGGGVPGTSEVWDGALNVLKETVHSLV